MLGVAGVPRPKGHGAKLKESEVVTIRERLAAGELGVMLAEEYGVIPATVSVIRTGRLWPHAGGPIRVPGRQARR